MAKCYRYALTGRVGYMQRPNDADDYFEGKELDIEFGAASDKAATKEAKEVIAAFLKENERYDPQTKKGASEDSRLEFRLQRTKTIFEMKWVPRQPAVEAVPAKPAREAIPAHIKAN